MFKKTRILILAAVTMVVMLLGSTGVFAAVSNSSTEPTITKNLTIASGVTLADTTVTFQVKQVTNPDGVTAPATIATYTTDGTVSSSKTTVDDIALGLASKIDTSKAGEYTFEVSETAPTEGTNWTTVDDTVYLVQVLVTNEGAVTYSVTDKNSSTTPAPKTDLTFTNVYEATADLSVEKKVGGSAEYADTEFEFTITFVANGDTAQIPSTVSGKIGSGNATNYTVTDGKATFKLKKDEKITFSGLPAGIKYTVAESSPSAVSYKDTKVDQTIDGTAQSQTTGLSSASNAVLGNKDTNSVTFTNNYKEISPTGIITHYLPYIAIILLAIGAFVFFVASRRRRAVRY